LLLALPVSDSGLDIRRATPTDCESLWQRYAVTMQRRSSLWPSPALLTVAGPLITGHLDQSAIRE
jgi:hypothetical protein